MNLLQVDLYSGKLGSELEIHTVDEMLHLIHQMAVQFTKRPDLRMVPHTGKKHKTKRRMTRSKGLMDSSVN
jgi:hypothetical protein